jgi:hypothetical protein
VPTYVWSSLHNETSAEAAVDRLNVAVTQSINSAFLLDTLKSINILLGFLET